MLKFIGFKRNTGVFQDKPYENYDLYYQVPIDGKEGQFGIIVEKVRFSKANFENLLKVRNITDPQKIIGLQFNEILYNAYRNATDVR